MNGYHELDRDTENAPAIFLSKNNTCLPHFHSLIELTYVIHGEITVIINGNTLVLHENCMSIASSYDVHSCASLGESLSYVLLIPIEFVSKYIANRSIFFNSCLLEQDEQSEILYVFERLHQHSSLIGHEQIVKSYINLLLSILINSIGITKKIGDPQSNSSRDILKYISENYAKELSLDHLAKKFGYSKYHFSRFFNSYFGCSLSNYINIIRVRNAAFLLTETDHSVTDIAFECGFGSLRNFYRLFKDTYHISPSKYADFKSFL